MHAMTHGAVAAAASPVKPGLPDTLPDDVLLEIFSRLDRPQSLLHCAAACKQWLRVIGAASSRRRLRAARRRYLPSLLLGFFYQNVVVSNDERCSRKKRPCLCGPPQFVPARQSLGRSIADLPDSRLHLFRPITSRNGRLVLLLDEPRRLEFCVFNPVTGNCSFLPVLSTDEIVRCDTYSCVLLTGDDNDGDSALPTSSFRLLLILDHCNRLCVRTFSSNAGTWSPAYYPDFVLTDVRIRIKCAAVIRDCLAYWPCSKGGNAYALTMHVDTMQASLLELPVTCLRHNTSREGTDVLIGLSEDGRLCLLGVRDLRLYVWIHQDAGNDGSTDGWVLHDDIDLEKVVYQPKRLRRVTTEHLSNGTRFRPAWFCEKSGAVLFEVGSRGRAFVFNLGTKTMMELVGWMHPYHYYCGYEMDWPPSFSPLGDGEEHAR